MAFQIISRPFNYEHSVDRTWRVTDSATSNTVFLHPAAISGITFNPMFTTTTIYATQSVPGTGNNLRTGIFEVVGVEAFELAQYVEAWWILALDATGAKSEGSRDGPRFPACN